MGMMLRQRAKRPNVRLAQADAVRLPYVSAQFDAVLTIHVLHLIGAWREALREFKRVLKPRGVYINTWNWHATSSVHTRVRDYWRKRVEARGGEWRRPGIQKREEVLDEARAIGAAVESVEVVRFAVPLAPREVVEGLEKRIFSDTWDVPPEIYEPTVRETREWAAQEFGDVTKPLDEEMRFNLDVIRF
jgi:SAM-dependent methyltransferase